MSEEEPTLIRRRAGNTLPPVAQQAPCVVVLTGRKVGLVHRLVPTGTVIGRGADSDLVLDDDGVSRAHCMIFAHADPAGSMVWRIRDLGSTNGTFLGERAVTGVPVDLREGDRVRLGSDVIVRFGTQDDIERQFLDQLYRSATRDVLTGLANRRFFQEQLDSEVAWHRRHDRPLSLLFLDIDRFKDVNDRFGHSTGDAVLVGVAHVLAGEVRVEDVVARHGGEEFVVLLRETPADLARTIAERLRAAVARQSFRSGPITVSCGVATATGEGIVSGEGLLQEADTRLLEAKKAGRNRVVS